CSDGRWVALSGSTDTMARRVLEAIGRPELFDDPRFATNEARLNNDDELDQLIADHVRTMTQDECLALFQSKGVTMGPIHNTPDLLRDTHVAGRECYVYLDSPQGGALMHNITPRLSGTPGAVRRRAPMLGEHTEEILSEAGVSQEEIARLKHSGAVK